MHEKETIVYNSELFKKQKTKIVSKIIAIDKRNSEMKKVVKESTIEPSSVSVYDHDGYIAVCLKFNTEITSIEYSGAEFEKGKESFSTGSLSTIYQNYWLWNNIDIYPNTKKKEFYLHIKDIIDATVITPGAKNYSLIMLTCPSTGAAIVFPDKTMSRKWVDIEKYIVQSELTDSELDFVKQYSKKQYEILEQKRNKDSLFKKISEKMMSKQPNKRNAAEHKTTAEDLHMSEQEKEVFDAEMLSISDGITNSQKTLDALIGLDEVKNEIKKLKAKLEYRKKQEERGIYVDSVNSMHMCFMGAPGTGKTTVARIITGILYEMGYIKDNKCVEINGQNMKGGYTGQTAIITKLVLRTAKNKVLFIDEAYALYDDYEGGFGREAIAMLLKQMEDERGNTIVIFAGYKDEMEAFLSMNDGLKSRINRYIDFKNYTTLEMGKIFASMLYRKQLYITEEAMQKSLITFKKASASERFSNARFVRNFIEKIEDEHAYNVYGNKDNKRKDTIELEDISDEIIEELLTRSM